MDENAYPALGRERFDELWSRVTGAGEPKGCPLETLAGFITDEAADAALYRRAARRFCGCAALFTRLSRDEARHYAVLQTAYFLLNGDSLATPAESALPSVSLPAFLRQRYIEETEGAAAYERAALECSDAKLKDSYRRFAGEERGHAMAIEKELLKIMGGE